MVDTLNQYCTAEDGGSIKDSTTTGQHNTTQQNLTQHSTAHCSTAQCSMALTSACTTCPETDFANYADGLCACQCVTSA